MNWRRAGFVVVEVLLLLAIPVLATAGFRAVLDTTEGRTVDPELDPTEPGYEAFVEPTPTVLLAGTNGTTLEWLALAALTGEGGQGGALLLVPVTTMVSVPLQPARTLAAAYAEDGLPGLEPAATALLGTGVGELVTVEPERLAALLAPVSPLRFGNPDDLAEFDAGEVVLGGSDVVAYLAAIEDGESELARLARHEIVWQAWFDAVAASPDPDVVPGEATAGVGRVVRGLAGGWHTIEVVRVSEGPDGTFLADPAAVTDLVEERVPFPVAATPGARARVRVLDGVGIDGLAPQVAREAVRAGAQVTVIGNADRFDTARSAVVYYDAAVTGAAERIAAALGIEPPERREGPNPDDLVDVTVVVGSDLADAYGLAVAVAPTTTTRGDDTG